MSQKPIKHGIKIFCLCCSYTGYIFGWEVYLGKEYTTDGDACSIVMRLLDDAGMHTTGEGRCLVTDNWYSTFKLMRLIWLTFKMLLIGTFTPTKKRSRTADDYPFPKLSNGAMKKIPQGWTRIAFQNSMTEKDVHRDAAKRKPLYTVQATI